MMSMRGARIGGVMNNLKILKEIARRYAENHNCPMMIVRPDRGTANICPASQKTGCEIIWTTDDVKPVQETPAQLELGERIARMQAELDGMKNKGGGEL